MTAAGQKEGVSILIKWMAIVVAALFILPLYGCQLDQPPMYVINREYYMEEYPFSDFQDTVAKDEYEAQGNPKFRPVQSNEAQWTAERMYQLLYHNVDEWRSVFERFDPLIQALYIWNAPANHYADTDTQLSRVESMMDPALYDVLVSSRYHEDLNRMLKTLGFKSEVNLADIGPYALAFTDGQGRRIVRYSLSVVQSVSKVGEYEIPPEYYDRYPYFTRGDAIINLFVYVLEDTQKIIQLEEVYCRVYYSNAYTPEGLVRHDVYPGYAYYLDHMVDPVHALPGGDASRDALEMMLYEFLPILYDENGAQLSRQKLEEVCTPALLKRLDQEGYLDARRSVLQRPDVSVGCSNTEVESFLPYRCYETRDGETVMLLTTKWNGAIALPDGGALPPRDANLVNSEDKMYRTSFYIVNRDGKYLIDEWMTHDYFKS